MKSLRFLGIIGLLAILGAVFAAGFFFGGFFNVAASVDDPDIVNAAIENVRAASIARHATVKPAVSLDDPSIVRAGAKSYAERGCTNCHGGPGVEWAKFSEGLNPGPPDLKDVVGDLLPQELFWVIKNGIKMTGMPSFGVTHTDDEVWAIVAFVRRMGKLTPEQYQAMVQQAGLKMPESEEHAEAPQAQPVPAKPATLQSSQ
jgi:mono/diheme cytochrome c family protein